MIIEIDYTRNERRCASREDNVELIAWNPNVNKKRDGFTFCLHSLKNTHRKKSVKYNQLQRAPSIIRQIIQKMHLISVGFV